MDDTPFVREIRMQPSAIRTAAVFFSGSEGVSLLSAIAGAVSSKRKIVFTGMGTSLYAPYMLMKELVEIPSSVEIWDAGELLHFGLRGFHGNEIIIAISQSGESAETKRVVEQLYGKVTVVSIVNDCSSFMGKNADFVLPLHAGGETSISTKTYTNTLSVLALLSTYIKREDPEATVQFLHDTADVMEKNLEKTHTAAKQAVRFFGNINTLQMVARGSDLVTAKQWALIIKEGAGTFSEALSAGLFRHGPIELAGSGHSVIYILSQGNEPELTLNLALETAKMGSKTLILSDRPEDYSMADSNIMYVPIECHAVRFFPLLCAPFIEFFVHEAAKKREREAGVFSHATKITSRE